MNKCEECGHEFEGEACPECGTETVHGKKVCPKCGAEAHSDAKFCEECGAKLNKTVICSVCGTEDYDGNEYCEKCGAKIFGLSVRVNKKVLTVFGTVCLLLSALLGVVFTFLCGVTATVEYEGINLTETQTVYYYFGDVYKDVDTLRRTIKSQLGFSEIGDIREFALLFPAILGTLISVVGMVGAVGLLALTVWQLYKKFYTKQYANFVKPAIGAYLCFVALSTSLLAMSATSAEASKVSFSATTLAGLITGGVFCAFGVFSLAMAGSDKVGKSHSGIGMISAVVGACISVVLVALLSQPAVGIKFKNLNVEQLNSLGGSFGLFPFMQSMLLLVEKDKQIHDMINFCTIGGVAGIAAAIFAVIALYRKLSGIVECENNSCFPLCIVIAAFSVFYFVGSIVMLNDFVDFMNVLVGTDVSRYISKTMTIPIVIMVISVAVTAVERLFQGK